MKEFFNVFGRCGRSRTWSPTRTSVTFPGRGRMMRLRFQSMAAWAVVCKNKAGEGAHMYKKHKQASILRSYIDQTRCRVCLRELHTYTKMKAHLYHSAACRAVLLTGSKCDELAPGAGSRAEKLLEHSHDRCLPPLQAAGPMTQPQRTRIFNDIDESLHIYMVDLLVEHGASEQATMEFGRATKAWILEHAISWTRTKNTLCFF